MNQNIEIMLDSLTKAFPNLNDIESRVRNIKERISLIQKSINYVPPTLEDFKTPISKKDTRSEMESLRAKLTGKNK